MPNQRDNLNGVRPTRHLTDMDRAINAQIRQLIYEVNELRSALAPFALLLKEHHSRLPDTQPIYGIGESLITVGHLRRAASMF